MPMRRVRSLHRNPLQNSPLEHARCGTAFLLTLVLISILVFTALGPLSLFWRLASRILLIPVLAGISVEYIRWMLEHEGFAMQGRYTPDAEDTEWVARRLLARMHSYSRRTRRQGVEPATAQDFMRFLLRWQHVAPGTQLAGEAGLAHRRSSSSRATRPRPSRGSPTCSRAACATTTRLARPACHDGEVGWLRLTPRAARRRRRRGRGRRRRPRRSPSCSATTSRGCSRRRARRRRCPASRRSARPPRSSRCCANAARASPPSSAPRPAACPKTSSAALWDGVARGLVTSDGFGAIRGALSSRRAADGTDARRIVPARCAAPGHAAAAAGRWSLVPATGTDVDRDELAEAVAELLLNRWGVVFRDLAVHDSVRFPWRDIQWALRRLEDRGLVRGGRFVTGFSGEQYALPEAVEQLTRTRSAPQPARRSP